MSLLKVPSEILLLILESCDSLVDALALGSACKKLHSGWELHGNNVLWYHLKFQIPAIEEALIAVRASQIVADHEARGELPPIPLNLYELSETRKKPSLAELNTVWVLSRLFDEFCEKSRETLHYPPEVSDDEEELPHHRQESLLRLHRALYRVLIAGAALSGTYNAPLFETTLPLGSNGGMTKEAAEVLDAFTVYKVQPSPESELAAFGEFAGWLRDNILTTDAREAMAKRHQGRFGRGLCCQNNNEDGQGFPSFAYSEYDSDGGGSGNGARGGSDDGEVDLRSEPDDGPNECSLQSLDGLSHSDTHLLIWEVMQMLWAEEKLDEAFEYPSNRYVNGRDTRYDGELRFPLVIFGNFQAKDITIRRESEPPHKYKGLALWPAYCDEGSPGQSRQWQRFCCVGSLNWILEKSGKPNRYKGSHDPVTPLHLKLFDFLLRHYGRARLPVDFFQGDWAMHWRDMMTFVESFSIFMSDEPADWQPLDGDLLRGNFMDGAELLRPYKGRPKTY